MLTLIKNASVYTPSPVGVTDVLIGGTKILAIESNLSISGNVEINIIDGSGMYLFPGFIDNHVHITGGGGEGGFATRTPELRITDAIDGGITTIIGTLGTDGYGRTMTDLLAKCASLEAEGLTMYANTGSYQIPVRTFTGSISEDLMFIDRIVGVGEIALSDHRSSCPTIEELEKIVSETRVAGMLAGKRGVVNVHIGDEAEVLEKVKKIVNYCAAYKKHFHPTHMNRSREVFDDALSYLGMGGSVDFTTSTTPEFLAEGEVYCPDAVLEVLERGLDISKVTMSSDGQGSLPLFDANGNMNGLTAGKVTSLYDMVRESIRKGVPVEKAVSLITSNVADIYGLSGKGYIRIDSNADLVLVNAESLEVDSVIAKGEVLRLHGINLKKETFS